MANKLKLEIDGLQVGTNQLITQNGQVLVGRNLQVNGNTYIQNMFINGTVFNANLTNAQLGNFRESTVTLGRLQTGTQLTLANGTYQTASLSSNVTCVFSMPQPVSGQSFTLLIRQDVLGTFGNGAALFTPTASTRWGIAGAPTISQTPGKLDIVSFTSDGVYWFGSYTQGFNAY
jgi:hypothetical protein